MTTLRPERSADGPMSYEDTGQFEVAVGQLADPLNDPLPGRPPVVQDRPTGSPWFRAPQSPDAEPDRRTEPDQQGGERQQDRYEQQGRPEPQPVRPRPAQHARPAPQPGQARPAEPPARSEPRTAVRPPAAGAATPPLPAPDETAKLPVFADLDPDPARESPDREPAAAPGATPPSSPTARSDTQSDAAQDTAQNTPLAAAQDATPQPAPGPPAADGGRAARRKAARAGGHRARGRTAPPPASASAASAQEPAAPLSRVEARRAAKAAKESPAVVISRVAGELFITAGVLMLLFVGYQLWWTNVRAHAQANSASNNLEHQWDNAQADPNRAPGTFSPGQGFAIMYIPKLDVKAPIAQGVSTEKVLNKGMIGHYDGALNTAMPWDKTGNFAVAAHRNTHGEPFRYINHLVPGDKVVVETSTTYYTYTVTSSLASTPPANTSVIQPVPPGSGFTKPGRYVTLTTCTPEFTSTNRLIVWGKLTEERSRSKGKPDALVNG